MNKYSNDYEIRFNPYHDDKGRFTTSSGGGAGYALYVGRGQKGKGVMVYDKEKYGVKPNNPYAENANGQLMFGGTTSNPYTNTALNNLPKDAVVKKPADLKVGETIYANGWNRRSGVYSGWTLTSKENGVSFKSDGNSSSNLTITDIKSTGKTTKITADGNNGYTWTKSFNSKNDSAFVFSSSNDKPSNSNNPYTTAKRYDNNHLFSGSHYETVKTVNGQNIYRMKGTHGFYHVPDTAKPNAYRTFKTQKAAKDYIESH